MASEKKGGQGGGQGRHNGGMGQKSQGQQGQQGQGWDVGGQIREGAENVSNRLREGYDTAREGLGRGYRRAEGTIARNPGPSVLIGFGVGFGLGIALVSMFAHENETWAERHIPDRLRRVPDSLRDSMKHVPDHVAPPGRGDRRAPSARDPQAPRLRSAGLTARPGPPRIRWRGRPLLVWPLRTLLPPIEDGPQQRNLLRIDPCSSRGGRGC